MTCPHEGSPRCPKPSGFSIPPTFRGLLKWSIAFLLRKNSPLPRQYNIGVQLIRKYLARPSRYSQGEALALLQREEVVPVRVDNGPDDDNPKERNEAGTVVHYRGERKHYRCPIDNIIDKKDESPGTSQPIRFRAAHGFSLPDRPPGRMRFDNSSVDHPENHHADKARKVRRYLNGQEDNPENQNGNPHCQRKPVIPTSGHESFPCHGAPPFCLSIPR